MVSITDTWQAARAARPAKPARESVVSTVVKFAARRIPTWRRFRSGIMQTAAFGFIDFAVFEWNHIVGYAAIGVSLFVLEALGGGK